MEVIESGFGVAVVAAVADGVDARHAAGTGEKLTPGVVKIRGNGYAAVIDDSNHIALLVGDVVSAGFLIILLKKAFECAFPDRNRRTAA